MSNPWQSPQIDDHDERITRLESRVEALENVVVQQLMRVTHIEIVEGPTQ